MNDFITKLFSACDLIARIIGWIVILYFSVKIFGDALQRRQLRKDAEKDKRNMMLFEAWLSEEKPEQYAAYRELKIKEERENPEIHWHWVAHEVGISTREICKCREPFDG